MCQVNLEPRELDVLRLVAAGFTANQIARILHLSYHTVNYYKYRAFDKVGGLNPAHAVVRAHQLGILDVNEVNPILIPILRKY
jgi:DNA-binding CsgD family transcriptional regulator